MLTLRPHRARIVEVPRRLAQQEQLFVRRRGPVGARFRHRVGLVPHDLAAQPPAVGLERHRHAGGHEHEIFRLESRRMERRLRFGAPVGRLLATAAAAAAAACIRIAVVQPQRAVLAQDPPHLAEHAHQVRKVRVERRLEPYHAIFAAVGPQPPVGRAADDALHGLGGQLAEPVAAIAYQDRDAHASRASRLARSRSASSSAAAAHQSGQGLAVHRGLVLQDRVVVGRDHHAALDTEHGIGHRVGHCL